MITIRSVTGDVAVLDQTTSYMETAVAGMVLKSGRHYLIASDGKSEAMIISDGMATKLSPGEYYLVTKDGKVRQGKHRERGNAKLFFGRLWAMIARDHKDLDLPGNVAVGIRG